MKEENVQERHIKFFTNMHSRSRDEFIQIKSLIETLLKDYIAFLKVLSDVKKIDEIPSKKGIFLNRLNLVKKQEVIKNSKSLDINLDAIEKEASNHNTLIASLQEDDTQLEDFISNLEVKLTQQESNTNNVPLALSTGRIKGKNPAALSTKQHILISKVTQKIEAITPVNNENNEVQANSVNNNSVTENDRKMQNNLLIRHADSLYKRAEDEFKRRNYMDALGYLTEAHQIFEKRELNDNNPLVTAIEKRLYKYSNVYCLRLEKKKNYDECIQGSQVILNRLNQMIERKPSLRLCLLVHGLHVLLARMYNAKGDIPNGNRTANIASDMLNQIEIEIKNNQHQQDEALKLTSATILLVKGKNILQNRDACTTDLESALEHFERALALTYEAPDQEDEFTSGMVSQIKAELRFSAYRHAKLRGQINADIVKHYNFAIIFYNQLLMKTQKESIKYKLIMEIVPLYLNRGRYYSSSKCHELALQDTIEAIQILRSYPKTDDPLLKDEIQANIKEQRIRLVKYYLAMSVEVEESVTDQIAQMLLQNVEQDINNNNNNNNDSPSTKRKLIDLNEDTPNKRIRLEDQYRDILSDALEDTKVVKYFENKLSGWEDIKVQAFIKCYQSLPAYQMLAEKFRDNFDNMNADETHCYLIPYLFGHVTSLDFKQLECIFNKIEICVHKEIMLHLQILIAAMIYHTAVNNDDEPARLYANQALHTLFVKREKFEYISFNYQINLSYLNMKNINLNDLDLTNVNFANTNLDGAKLCYAILHYVSLSNTNLKHADLQLSQFIPPELFQNQVDFADYFGRFLNNQANNKDYLRLLNLAIAQTISYFSDNSTEDEKQFQTFKIMHDKLDHFFHQAAPQPLDAKRPHQFFKSANNDHDKLLALIAQKMAEIEQRIQKKRENVKQI